MSHPFDDVAKQYTQKLADLEAVNQQLANLQPLQERKAALEKELEEMRGGMPATLKQNPRAANVTRLET